MLYNHILLENEESHLPNCLDCKCRQRKKEMLISAAIAWLCFKIFQAFYYQLQEIEKMSKNVGHHHIFNEIP